MALRGAPAISWVGVGMIVVGAALLLHQVTVTSGYYNFGFLGGPGRSFGVTLIPLLGGIGMLFYNGRSLAGRCLTGFGALIILAGIVGNMDIRVAEMSLLNVLLMLVLLVGGVGLVVRAVLPMESAPPR